VQIIGAGMLKALEQVHLAGFIHRDVKPANFVMAPADAPSPTAGARKAGCLAAQGGVVGVRRRLPHCAFGPIVASCGFEQPSQ
jgi:serine/threonine protein kinase